MHHSWTSKRLKGGEGESDVVGGQENDNEERPNGPDLHGTIGMRSQLADPVKTEGQLVHVNQWTGGRPRAN